MSNSLPKSSLHIDGIVPIIPTPFTAAEAVDTKALKGLIRFAADSGASAGCLPAYASEFYKLSESERRTVVATAVEGAEGRLPIIGQINYASAAQAAATALDFQSLGVSGVSVSVPHVFPVPEADLRRYFDTILAKLEVPLLIQDFNPGGPTISPEFIASLHRAWPQFRYVKLEEPLMAAKVKAVREATSDGVGFLEGWGGMYMPELIPAGICGVMPGLAVSDILGEVFRSLRAGRKDHAMDVFAAVLPQVVYSLQNMELFHHCEKRLLCERGLLGNAVVRACTVTPSPEEAEHIRLLNGTVMKLVRQLHLAGSEAVQKA